MRIPQVGVGEPYRLNAFIGFRNKTLGRWLGDPDLAPARPLSRSLGFNANRLYPGLLIREGRRL
jgi:hypothetical protein